MRCTTKHRTSLLFQESIPWISRPVLSRSVTGSQRWLHKKYTTSLSNFLFLLITLINYLRKQKKKTKKKQFKDKFKHLLDVKEAQRESRRIGRSHRA